MLFFGLFSEPVWQITRLQLRHCCTAPTMLFLDFNEYGNYSYFHAICWICSVICLADWHNCIEWQAGSQETHFGVTCEQTLILLNGPPLHDIEDRSQCNFASISPDELGICDPALCTHLPDKQNHVSGLGVVHAFFQG